MFLQIMDTASVNKEKENPMAFTLWRDRENRIVDPELFSTKAEEFAQQIDREGTSTINKRTQLRNFYDEIMRLNIQAQDNPDAWDLVLPQVHMVIAKAAYAKGRNLISDGFLARIRWRPPVTSRCSPPTSRPSWVFTDCIQNKRTTIGLQRKEQL